MALGQPPLCDIMGQPEEWVELKAIPQQQFILSQKGIKLHTKLLEQSL